MRGAVSRWYVRGAGVCPWPEKSWPGFAAQCPLLQHWLFGSAAIRVQMLVSRLVEKAGSFRLQKAK